MKTIAVSKFKATCLGLLEHVLKTGQPLLITKKGKPLAQVIPPPPEKKRAWLGAGIGTGVIKGDIVSPAVPLDDWDALK